MKSYKEWRAQLGPFAVSGGKEDGGHIDIRWPRRDPKKKVSSKGVEYYPGVVGRATSPEPRNNPEVCPFCKTRTVEKRLDSSHSNYVTVPQCNKCFKYWNSDDLDPSKAKHSAGLIENKLYNLYLSGLIDESTYYENQQQPNQQQPNQQQPNQQQPNQQQPNQQQPNQSVDINQIAQQLQFQPTSKKKLTYQFSQNTNKMSPMTYAVAQQKTPVKTFTSDGKETQNVAEQNDIIVSGASGETYVVKADKFPKLYVGKIGGPIHPEQGPRNVALYQGNATVNFKAPWGESMVLKPGDYLVKEDEGKYYRIAKKEYEMTYNPPGKVG